MRYTPKLIIPIIFILLFASCSKKKPVLPETTHNTSPLSLLVDATDRESCLQAARKMLGPGGEVLKCGHLNNATTLETIIATRVPGLKDDKHGISVSRLLVLRRNKSQWDIELTVDKEIKNSAGFIGVNFIDDSHPCPYYRVNFSDQGAKWGDRSPSLFTMVLVSITQQGKVDEDDLGLGIGWNPAVGRFQEIEPNGEEFAFEKKTPKHIRNPRP
jgi:hypothetical protein